MENSIIHVVDHILNIVITIVLIFMVVDIKKIKKKLGE
jgi:hypothetical protein